MNENSEILRRSAINADCQNIQNLVFSVLREYGLEPDLPGTDRDIADIEANYTNRGGVFELLETMDGELVGTVGLYPLNGETVELRKMYFSPKLRGRGIGRETLQRMIETAKTLGFKRIYLETATVLVEAVKLYEKFGFAPTDEKHTPRCDAAYTLTVNS